jgi:hypothetical protein
MAGFETVLVKLVNNYYFNMLILVATVVMVVMVIVVTIAFNLIFVKKV